jgi:hypothetical protein
MSESALRKCLERDDSDSMISTLKQQGLFLAHRRAGDATFVSKSIQESSTQC